MADFYLFGTEACHLCEEAEAVLLQQGIEFKFQDIMENEEWLQKYALKIPVLLHIGSQQQLDWPFDGQKVQSFYGL